MTRSAADSYHVVALRRMALLVPLPEAAKHFEVSIRTLYRWSKADRLRICQKDGVMVCDVSEIPPKCTSDIIRLSEGRPYDSSYLHTYLIHVRRIFMRHNKNFAFKWRLPVEEIDEARRAEIRLFWETHDRTDGIHLLLQPGAGELDHVIEKVARSWKHVTER